MTRIPQVIVTALLCSCACAGLAAAQTLSVSVDAALPAEITQAAKSAEADSNYTAALREYKRLLEVFPNEPGMQAPVYLAMSVDAEKAGDSEQAELFRAISRTLDPSLEGRAAKVHGDGNLTRGGSGKGDTILAFAQMALNGYAAIRASKQQQQAQQPQQGQYQQQGQPGQPGQNPQQAGGYNYPQQAYGQQGYQPPTGNQYTPTPGYSDPNAQHAQPQGQFQQPAPQGQYQQQPAPGQYQPQPQTDPSQMQPQGQYQPPVQGQYPAQPQQGQYQPPVQGQYPAQPQQGQYQQQSAGYYPASQPAPYGAPAGGGRRRATRGEEPSILKVVYDRSGLGDTTYFANGCGALLSTDNGDLIFTPGCGFEPRLIPAGEVWEVRLNTTVGRDVGAFHIITKKGMYLELAPSTGDRDLARADVEALRKSLGLDH